MREIYFLVGFVTIYLTVDVSARTLPLDDLDKSAIFVWYPSGVHCPKSRFPTYLVSPYGKDHFIRCSDGYAQEYRCPDSLPFDFERKRCQQQDNFPKYFPDDNAVKIWPLNDYSSENTVDSREIEKDDKDWDNWLQGVISDEDSDQIFGYNSGKEELYDFSKENKAVQNNRQIGQTWDHLKNEDTIYNSNIYDSEIGIDVDDDEDEANIEIASLNKGMNAQPPEKVQLIRAIKADFEDNGAVNVVAIEQIVVESRMEQLNDDIFLNLGERQGEGVFNVAGDVGGIILDRAGEENQVDQQTLEQLLQALLSKNSNPIRNPFEKSEQPKKLQKVTDDQAISTWYSGILQFVQSLNFWVA